MNKLGLIMILAVVTLVTTGCFQRPATDTDTPLDTSTGSESDDNTVDEDMGEDTSDDLIEPFDPQNFEDPEVEEVFNLIEGLIAEDEAALDEFEGKTE